jgi:hypothetical protein
MPNQFWRELDGESDLRIANGHRSLQALGLLEIAIGLAGRNTTVFHQLRCEVISTSTNPGENSTNPVFSIASTCSVFGEGGVWRVRT